MNISDVNFLPSGCATICAMGVQINVKEVYLFQFSIPDKWKIYAHRRKNNLIISLITNDHDLLGIYIPPAIKENGSVFLNARRLTNLFYFMDSLNRNLIAYRFAAYERKELIDLVRQPN